LSPSSSSPSLCAAQPKATIREAPSLNVPEALRQGTELVADLLSRGPEDSIRTNLLRIKPRGGQEQESPVRFEVRSTPDSWVSTYEVMSSSAPGSGDKLVVISRAGQANQYTLSQAPGLESLARNASCRAIKPWCLLPARIFGSPIWGWNFCAGPASSSSRKSCAKASPAMFWRALTLIPRVRLFSCCLLDRHRYRRHRPRRCLRFRGPHPQGVRPSELQKVEGRMQVKEIEMRNRQTGSRSWVTFDLR